MFLFYESDGFINFDNLSEFFFVDYVFLGFYVKEINKGKGFICFGGLVKVVYCKIGFFVFFWGFGVDFGVQIVCDKWVWVVLVKDIIIIFNVWSFFFIEEEKDILELINNEVLINLVEIICLQLIFGGVCIFEFNDKVSLQLEVNLIFMIDGQ